MDEKSTSRPTLPQRRGRLFGFITLIIALILGLVWIFRMPIVSSLITQWCSTRDLGCQLEITRLDFGGLQAHNLSLAGDPHHPSTLDNFAISFDWTGPFSPNLAKVSATRPLVRAQIKSGRLDLYGLERLFARADQTSHPSDTAFHLPQIDIRDAQIELATEAGTLMAMGNLQGEYPVNLAGYIEVAPTRLVSGENIIDGSLATGEIEVRNGTLTGALDIDLTLAALGDTRLEGITLSSQLEGNGGPARLSWTVEARRIQFETGASDLATARHVKSHGEAVLSEWQALNSENPAASFERVSLELRTQNISHTRAEIASPILRLDLKRVEGLLSGPVALTADLIATPEVNLQNPALAGDLQLPQGELIPAGDGSHGKAAGAVRFDGGISVETATIQKQTVRKALALATPPDALKPHYRDLTSRLAGAGEAFQFGLDFTLAAHTLQDWSVTARRPISLRSDSGLEASIAPFGNQTWLDAGPEALALSGAISIGGGGLPDLRATLDTLFIEDDTLQLKARGIKLPNWHVDASQVFALVETLDYQRTPTLHTARFRGELGISGQFDGLDFGRTSFFGALEGAEGQEGWRVQTPGASCLGLNTQGLKTEALALGAVGLSFCPQNGRLMHTVDGRPMGILQLGDVTLPFSSNDTEGVLQLEDAHLNWAADAGFSMDLNADRFDLGLTLAGESLHIRSRQPRIAGELSHGPAAFEASLERTVFSGSLIPADASAERFSASVRTQSDGLAGRGRAVALRLSDPNSDPLYKPLVADLTADVSAGTLFVSGPVRLAHDQTDIASANMHLDLGTLDGVASLRTGELIFSPDGLQPRDLSDLLRGELTSAAGGVSAMLNFEIEKGVPSGTADIAFSDLSFQTVSFDQVNGVNGLLHFDDIFALTTPPNQIVQIGQMNPGLLLNDGELRFQILGPDAVQLQAASWPFAGGRLNILPTRWTLNAPRQTVTAELTAVQLADLIETLKIPDTEADGTVSGVFPIDIEGADVYVRQALLKVDEDGGRLKYLGGATEQAGKANPFAEQAFEALKDFRFSVMEVGASGNLIDEITVNMRLEGMNPDVLEGTEFVFNIGLTSKLAQLLESLSLNETTAFIERAFIEDLSKESSDEPTSARPFN